MFAGATTVLFVIAKVIEARISKRDATSVRNLVRDASLVGTSALAAVYLKDAMSSITKSSGSPSAYVNAPEF